jgi:hypothetical protein
MGKLYIMTKTKTNPSHNVKERITVSQGKIISNKRETKQDEQKFNDKTKKED